MATVFLCGLMGSGKSTVGPLLASRLGVPFLDLDRAIEGKAGCSVADIFDREGEAGFRARETAALREVADADGVVALGGGALARRANLELVLAAGTLVWLDAPDEELLARIGDPSSRPLLAGDASAVLARLRRERAGQYGQAHLHVDTSGLSPDAVAARIAEQL
jgi:shikimate kinase